MILVTLDTNVLIGGIDGDAESRRAFDTLRKYEQLKVIQLALTSRFDLDKASDGDIARVKRHYRVARMFPSLSGPFRIGISAIGGPDHIVRNNHPNFDAILGIRNRSTRSQNSVADSDHLYAHWSAGYDYFLTCDRPILKKAKVLASVGVKVLSPTTFVDIAKCVIDNPDIAAVDRENVMRRSLDSVL